MSVPAVTVDVTCGGEIHQLSWSEGRLILHHHDANAEIVATTLGASPPTCVAILAAWGRHRRSVLAHRSGLSAPHGIDFPNAPEETVSHAWREATDRGAWFEQVGRTTKRRVESESRERQNQIRSVGTGNIWSRRKARRIARQEAKAQAWLSRVPAWVESQKQDIWEEADARLLAALPQELLARFEMEVAIQDERHRLDQAAET